MNTNLNTYVETCLSPSYKDFYDIDRFIEYVKYPVQTNSIWFLNYLNHFNPKTLFLKCFNRQDKEIIGILPLEEVSKRATRFWNYRIMQPFSGEILDFFEPFVMPGKEEVFSISIAEWFYKNRNIWDELNINQLPETSLLADILKEKLIERGFDIIENQKRYFYKIDTRIDWDNYFNGFLKNKLKDLQNRQNRIFREGIKFDFIHLYENIEQYLSTLFELYINRRVSLQQKFGYSNENRRKFLFELLKDLQLRKEVVLSIMQTNEKQIMAFQLDLLYEGIRYHYLPAFNPQFSKFSPSKILLLETLKNSFMDKEIKEFNFMRGESNYKAQFANIDEKFVNFKIQNPYSRRRKLTIVASKVIDLRNILIK